MSGISSGVEHAYLAKVINPQTFPHPPNVQLATKPRFNGSVDQFLAQHGASDATSDPLRRKLKNKVKKCPMCGKPCAFCLQSCNSCSADLSKVPISLTDNVFTAFIFGIAKCPFPATISVRSQTPEFLAFDDLLALAPCHLNSIPTSIYCPDWRYLLQRPEEGLRLVDRLFEHAYQAAKSQFWDNIEWRRKFLTEEAGKLTDAQVRDLVICGMNYPPSQFQLHLQFMLPPLLPFHFNLALQHQHFHHGRFFPLSYIKKVLQKQADLECQRFNVVTDDTSIEDIMAYFDSHDVVYNDEHKVCIRRYEQTQRDFANWNPEDFECLVFPNLQQPGKKVLSRENLELVKDADASKIQSEDKLALQGYGRPYGPDGKPSGTFYAYACSVEELADWTDAPTTVVGDESPKRQKKGYAA